MATRRSHTSEQVIRTLSEGDLLDATHRDLCVRYPQEGDVCTPATTRPQKTEPSQLIACLCRWRPICTPGRSVADATSLAVPRACVHGQVLVHSSLNTRASQNIATRRHYTNHARKEAPIL